MHDRTSSSAAALPATGSARFDGRLSFQAALRAAIQDAAGHGARQIWMVDADFDDWPIGEQEVVDDLKQWALTSHLGRCVLVAANYERFIARARWLEWRKTWGHRVTCLKAPDEWVPRMPSLMFVPGRLSVERLDLTEHRGLISRDPGQWVSCQERCDAISQRSTEALPITTLGL